MSSQSVEDYHDKTLRIFLKILGIWPYQDPKWIHVQAIIIISLYTSILFVMSSVFITHECTINTLVDILSHVFFVSFAFLMYGIYYFNRDFLKEIMDFIFYNWKSCKNNAELTILNNYAYIAKMLTKIFLCLTYIGLFCIVMFYAILPLSLNIISTRNESRMPYQLKYFTDQYKYCSIIALLILITTCLCTITAVCTGCMFLDYILHICAMLKITNYRMEIMMDQNILLISNAEKEYIIYQRLICAVDVHRKTIQFCKFLISNLDIPYIFAMIIGVTSLSINLYRFLKAITMLKDLDEIIMTTALVISHFIYIFTGCHVGQQVIDLNADIFKTIYNLPWYTAPRNIQRLLLFLLQNRNKDLYLSFKDIFVISHECCKMLVTTSISYFTVIYSIQ